MALSPCVETAATEPRLFALGSNFLANKLIMYVFLRRVFAVRLSVSGLSLLVCFEVVTVSCCVF